MKFKDYIYERINIKKISDDIINKSNKISSSNDISTIISTIKEVFKLLDDIDTNFTLASIRNSIDQTDSFYEEEINYINNNKPYFYNARTVFNKALVNHKLRKDLEKEFGDFWFKLLDLSLKTYNQEIDSLLVEESNLVTEYNKLLATAKIEFNGNSYTLTQMGKFANDLNRDIRKQAAIKVDEFFLNNEDTLDDIFDKLIKVRHQMAIKLGYKNYIDLAYANLRRTDYNSEMVSKYRDMILTTVTPMANKIFEEKRKMLKLDSLESFDLAIDFIDGNPTPKGSKDELVSKALDMYKQMSPETHDFFKFMCDHELLDLESKNGKRGGGYCTLISNYKSPFIFANFNQTSADVDVLTHEAGHAFQIYTSLRNVSNPDLLWPTYEACEIHSMSMEFFAYPYIEAFFKEDTNKYKEGHLKNSLVFLPYGALIDHFQHEVYNNINLTKEERKKLFKDLESKYVPHKKYTYQQAFNKGCFFYRQGHIFSSPFYYIDYTLAQVVAFSFYLESKKDYQQAFKKYVELCKLGGTKSFIDLCKTCDLLNPFEINDTKKVIDEIYKII